MIPILSGNVASAIGGGYEVANSCRFNSGDSAYLSKTTGTATNTDKCTISFWVKRGFKASGDHKIIANYTDTNNRAYILFAGDNYLQVFQKLGGSTTINLKTNRLFRDHSAWYNIIVAVDTSQGVSANRIKIYVNGVQETSFETATYPSQNENFRINESSVSLNIGRKGEDAEYFDGYLSEFVLLDGQTLTPTSFGEFDDDSPTIWKPKDVSGLTFGDNGFYLDFEDSGDLGDDESGNTNDFTENNLTAVDQTTDTCTNNFATMNPLIPDGSVTLAEGNLKVSSIGDNDWRAGTFGGSFKWYAECKINVAYDGSGGGICIGAISEDGLTENNGGTFGMSLKNAKWYTNSNDGKFQEGNGTNVTTGLTRASTNDIVGVACDGANGRIYIHVNGTYLNSGDPVGGSGFIGGTTGYQGIWFPFSGSHLTKGQGSWNFGNAPFSISSGNADANGYGNFEYAVPSGYLALCTKNLGSDGG